MMEKGDRRVPDHFAREVTRLLRLSAAALPLPSEELLDKPVDESWVTRNLARLGYPGFAYLDKPGKKRNPVELLLRALALHHLDPRLAEALAWLLLHFEEMDVYTLVSAAKLRGLQNRLGFTVSLARQVANHNPAYKHRSLQLLDLEKMMEPSRLAREDTYCEEEMSERMMAWVRVNRSAAARHWNLLTDLKMEHLSYAG